MEKFVAVVESRKYPGEYWETVMNDQKISKEIQSFHELKSEIQLEKNPKTPEQLVEDSKHKCEEPLTTNAQVTIGKNVFTGYFEPILNMSAYDDNDVDTKENKGFVKDFEPRQSVTSYNDNKAGYKGEYLLVNSQFEPRLSVTRYNN